MSNSVQIEYGPTLTPLDDNKAALQMIREAIEAYGPPGALPSSELFGTATDEAEAIIAAIREMAGARG